MWKSRHFKAVSVPRILGYKYDYLQQLPSSSAHAIKFIRYVFAS